MDSETVYRTVMGSLDGKMDPSIVGIIIMDKGKEMENSIMQKIRVSVEDFGRREYWKDKVSMLRRKERCSSVFGVKERFPA